MTYNTMIHHISNKTLTIEKVNEIITKGYKLELSKERQLFSNVETSLTARWVTSEDLCMA